MTDAEKDKMILVTTENGNPKFNLTDAQLEVAERAFQSQIDIGLDYSEEEEAVYRQREGKKDGYAPEYKYNAGKAEKAETQMVSQWNNLRNVSDPSKRQNILDAILTDPKSVNAGIKDIRFSTNSAGQQTLDVIYTNPAKNKTGDNGVVIASDAKAIPTQEEWALAGVSIHGVSDPTRLEKASGGYRPDPTDFKYVNPTGVQVKRDDVPMSPKEAVDAAYGIMMKEFKQDNLSGMDDDDAIAPALAKIGKKFGIVVVDGYNSVTITKPGQDAKTFSQDEVEAMMSYMSTDINPGQAEKYFKTQTENKKKTKRTIAQIMKEDGVDRAEATKRFKNQ